jgi:hypothetical protein
VVPFVIGQIRCLLSTLLLDDRDFYDFDSAAVTRSIQLPAGRRFDISNPSFAVAPDGSWIVYTQLDQWGSDIEMIDGFD